MNWIFKLAFFNLSLNFAIGLLILTIPVFGELRPTMGLKYDSNLGSDFEIGMNGSINPSGDIEDTGDAIYRVLDFINLGMIKKFVTLIDTLMFGFWNQMESLLGGLMSATARLFIFTTLKIFITIGYILGAFYLWTGKDVTGGT